MLDTVRLRKLRDTKKQKEIAASIGISQNHYSQIENGIKTPSLELAIRLAQYHGVHIDEILASNHQATPSCLMAPTATAAGSQS